MSFKTKGGRETFKMSVSFQMGMFTCERSFNMSESFKYSVCVDVGLSTDYDVRVSEGEK